MGLKWVVVGQDGVGYLDLKYVWWYYIYCDVLWVVNVVVVNVMLVVCCLDIWGEGIISCVSDVKKYVVWDGNLWMQWFIWYGGDGVMIYWYVERWVSCIYFSMKFCLLLEVVVMIEGVLCYCIMLFVEKNYVDIYGQSELGFVFMYLLGFKLMFCLVDIVYQWFYLLNMVFVVQVLNFVVVQVQWLICWDFICQQYELMVKYVMVLWLGLVDFKVIL